MKMVIGFEPIEDEAIDIEERDAQEALI